MGKTNQCAAASYCSCTEANRLDFSYDFPSNKTKHLKLRLFFLITYLMVSFFGIPSLVF